LRLRIAWDLVKQAVDDWIAAKCPTLGAALAYYSVFSIAPLLILVIAAASVFFGEQAAEKNIAHEIEGTLGGPVARAIQSILANNAEGTRATGATVIGLVLLLVGAAGVFGQLHDSLNTIFGVEPKPSQGIGGWFRDRFMSLTMVMGTGFLLLVSLIINTVLSAMNSALTRSWLGDAVLWQTVNLAASFAIITVLFAFIYKFIPDVQLAWRDMWVGAMLTSALFVLGKYVLGWYLGQASTTSAYGAAGSLVVILLWVYYASQILLFGAAFTRVYANRLGSNVKPSSNAVLVNPRMSDSAVSPAA
jgi:membrane protein